MAAFYVRDATLNLGFLSHGLAAVAFTFLIAVLLTGWRGRVLGTWLVFASLVTAIWAGLGAYQALAGHETGTAFRAMELFRSAVWIGFVLGILSRTWMGGPQSRLRLFMPWAIGLFCASTIGLELAGFGFGSLVDGRTGVDLAIFGRLVLALLGLLLVENLYSSALPQHRWAIKYLCLGVGALFSYDFFLYSDALLFTRVNPDLQAARGAIHALIVPLLAVSAARNPDWSLDIFVSRQVIFHSATLFGAGAYLLLMAAAGYYLREFGGQWGPAVQAVFLFGAVILLIVVTFSGKFRAVLRVFINKHFFNYKYDYREEWLRFIQTIAAVEGGGLHQRAIQAVADIVDSPEGALWLRHDSHGFASVCTWNCRVGPAAEGEADPGFIALMENRQWVIDLEQYAAQPELYDQIALPAWLTDVKRARLVVPLMHHGRLAGVLLLGQPRAKRPVNWEDFDLLRTVGRQVASYLVEQQAAQSLAESRQFDEFNRRFAFVIHDIKNLVSQLSLMVNNAQKHKDNPAFQADMVETVRESVEKMKRLMVRLHEHGKDTNAAVAVELESFLGRAVDRAARTGGRLAFDGSVSGLVVMAETERLAAVIAHLIDNAIEASDDGGQVWVRLAASDGSAVIEVEDDGRGMTPAFIRDELFRPFRSTKGTGYGIGAFECREYVRELGGKLDVVSKIGVGTTIRVTLPTTHSPVQPAPTQLIAATP